MCDGLRPMGGNSMRLESIARVIRSKNAGPCLLTFDVMLPDQAAFAYVTERAASLPYPSVALALDPRVHQT